MNWLAVFGLLSFGFCCGLIVGLAVWKATIDTLKALPWDYERPWTVSDLNTMRRLLDRPDLKFTTNWRFMPAEDEAKKP